MESYWYNCNKSHDILIGSKITHDLVNNILELEIEYKEANQRLGIARQKTKAIPARFGFYFKIGK